MMLSSGKTILFDLDGTLVDPAAGIISSYRKALSELDRPVPPPEDLPWIIGPPLRKSFQTVLGFDEALIAAAVASYRKHYAAGGIFDATPYNGIFEALAGLKEAGHTLFVCTAKPEVFARQVITHFGFTLYFDEIYGPDLGGRHDEKTDLIAHMIATEKFEASQSVMIGDRANDTRAAADNNMRSIGVLWGFGDEAELLDGGASHLCASPADLIESVNLVFKDVPGSMS